MHCKATKKVVLAVTYQNSEAIHIIRGGENGTAPNPRTPLITMDKIVFFFPIFCNSIRKNQVK
jgi:hypothetical protein